MATPRKPTAATIAAARAAAAPSSSAGRGGPQAQAHPDPVELNRVLAQENISFPTYTLMLALEREGRPLAGAELGTLTGYSYWAVRNQVRRTPYFSSHSIPGIRASVTIYLADEGVRKLERIRKRMEKPPEGR